MKDYKGRLYLASFPFLVIGFVVGSASMTDAEVVRNGMCCAVALLIVGVLVVKDLGSVLVQRLDAILDEPSQNHPKGTTD